MSLHRALQSSASSQYCSIAVVCGVLPSLKGRLQVPRREVSRQIPSEQGLSVVEGQTKRDEWHDSSSYRLHAQEACQTPCVCIARRVLFLTRNGPPRPSWLGCTESVGRSRLLDQLKTNLRGPPSLEHVGTRAGRIAPSWVDKK